MAATYWIILSPQPFVMNALDLVSLDREFRAIIVGGTVLMLFIYVTYEHIIFRLLNKPVEEERKGKTQPDL